ncbi:MAG TPA: SDR family NAD(P)-dependent oxidoreductase [Solirubrobacteraceae bacterium]|jgi:NAD(P)-dependent dehydrogenase (short-subunit alcohol dehydrogenase family)|nr:SDR family NAD(P)-dependent oxidoreductase [Solirubrobacteraceae bacterium]
MSRVFITGSAEGLGSMAANLLIDQGHDVTLHARSASRAEDALAAAPGATTAVVADLSSIGQTRRLAEQLNELQPFDAVIHNAGVGYREPRRILTEDGLEHIFAVNTLAPYLLTALMSRPKRLVYLSSGLHQQGDVNFEDFQWERRRWNGSQAYADSKLHDAILAAAVAVRWPGVRANAVEPGWVATKMGGRGAPDDLMQGPVTQAWLAVSDDAQALTTGGYFYHRQPREPHPAMHDPTAQQGLLDACAALTSVVLPE